MPIDPNALTTLAKLQAYLGLSIGVDETILEASIDRASVTIESVLGRKIKARDLYEWHDCNGTDRIGVRVRPINHVSYVAFGSTTALEVRAASGSDDVLATVGVTESKLDTFRIRANGQTVTHSINFSNHETTAELATELNALDGFAATAVDQFSAHQLHPRAGVNVMDGTAYLTAAWDVAADLRVESRTGIISFISDAWPSDNWTARFPQSPMSVLVKYNGGVDVIPYDIEAVCLEVAAQMYRDRRRDGGVQSESLGDYSYTLGDAGRMVGLIRSRLGAQMRIR